MTMYPTFNWKSFALKLVTYIEENDTYGMMDAVKDYRLFEDIPCPSITIGGPDGGTWPSAPKAEKDEYKSATTAGCGKRLGSTKACGYDHYVCSDWPRCGVHAASALEEVPDV